MAALDEAWRPLFATALYTGMRKGELLGLRKTDVDLAESLIMVRRSWGRDTTKGGHADAIPVAADLAPFLKVAIAASPSALVFPAADGSMMREQVRLHDVLRRVLGRAGIVQGYRHACRARVNGEGRRDPSGPRCTHAEMAADRAPRRCPATCCGRRPKSGQSASTTCATRRRRCS
jgi:integrase